MPPRTDSSKDHKMNKIILYHMKGMQVKLALYVYIFQNTIKNIQQFCQAVSEQAFQRYIYSTLLSTLRGLFYFLFFYILMTPLIYD